VQEQTEQLYVERAAFGIGRVPRLYSKDGRYQRRAVRRYRRSPPEGKVARRSFNRTAERP
jgi:hypothetical protein